MKSLSGEPESRSRFMIENPYQPPNVELQEELAVAVRPRKALPVSIHPRDIVLCLWRVRCGGMLDSCSSPCRACRACRTGAFQPCATDACVRRTLRIVRTCARIGMALAEGKVARRGGHSSCRDRNRRGDADCDEQTEQRAPRQSRILRRVCKAQSIIRNAADRSTLRRRSTGPIMLCVKDAPSSSRAPTAND